MPQQPAVYSKLSVAENLRAVRATGARGRPRDAVARMLEQTGLAERATTRSGRLSGGNRQRVNIAVGLLADPPVFSRRAHSALDPRQRARLWEFIQAARGAGHERLFSTHNVAEAERYADRVLVLDEGRLLFDGPPQRSCAKSPAAVRPWMGSTSRRPLSPT